MDKATPTISDIVSLHGVDQVPTRVERELFARAFEKLWKDDVLPLDVIAAELVELGVPTLGRARDIAMAHFAPGGLPPLQEDGKPSLAWLILKHSSDLTTAELFSLILKHHPAVAIEEIAAELRRQAESNEAEAAALERELAHRAGRRAH